MADSHRITFEPVDIEMEVDEDETILDAAFRQGIHLMHGCREGQCSACKSFVLDGDIQMDDYSTFACNDAETEEGYVLLCRSYAYGDCEIELLNFDEDELLGGAPIQDITTTVTAIEPMTADIVSLQLQVSGTDGFQFKAGQYVDLRIPGTDHTRSFSLATTPATPDRLEFLIKKYPGGLFAGILDSTLQVGDEIGLTGPFGNFTVKDGRVLPIVAIGGGAGMAPVLSLLRHAAQTGLSRPMHFYYGARTAADLFYLDEIVSLGAQLETFSFTACLSECADDAPAGITVESGNVTDIVARTQPDLARTEVYFCGPPPMVDAALALADSAGVPKDQVFFDKFNSPAFSTPAV
ncbi:2Fe-2S iron-sulfur cluster binding domain-containing protein [Gordonia desulfuricans]|uniref:2Fe-2S iron-sulfur cluster binding domain-containing protein n=1 Tax=Gordonia desulfuricans TaxID=89051 RepID=A0A7K3LTP0_9ACTN|nr:MULTISPECIES: 2Fe-2S iron-sulfur cluster-binding protein [Gordonia]EMP13067.1 CDP-6-deoxy-delta-3,4-glucoseen reductase [Gordonia sp. NB41Y]NDK91599.1 2Fe-2S iron-sulfur cluster binding domain-containing protein [Gordonia desulfuricans]WLP89826.1 FAD-binding oxidoreductase [Gordonia sp. NB41Y]